MAHIFDIDIDAEVNETKNQPWKNLNPNSVFMDIGSGNGKPSLVARQILNGPRVSLGIEESEYRVERAAVKLNLAFENGLITDGVKFIAADAMNITTLDGITHLYSFDIGNDSRLTNHILKLFVQSSTVQVWISHYEMGDPALDAFQLPFSNKLSGSGYGKSIFLYKKKLTPNICANLPICPLVNKCMQQDMKFLYRHYFVKEKEKRKRCVRTDECGSTCLLKRTDDTALRRGRLAGSISLSLSLSQHQDSGCTDSTVDNHLEEDTRSNLDNSDCSAGSSNGNGHCSDLAARPAPQQRHSVSSPRAGLALAGVAVVVSKRNSQAAALTAQPPARPLPDPAAFEPAGAMEDCEGNGDEAGSALALAAHMFCPAGSPTGPICPPTPAHTPHWEDHHHHHHHHHQGRAVMAAGRAHAKLKQDGILHGRHKESGESSSWLIGEDRDIDRDARRTSRASGMGIPPMVGLHRQSSLDESKLLLDGRSGGESASTDVNFSKDFEHLDVLGKGVFGDVFLARSRLEADGDASSDPSSSIRKVGKLFAVKKSRKQFRSKSDREWLLNEVRAMKKISDGFQDSRITTSECLDERESEGMGKDHPGVYIVQFIRAWQEDSYFYVQIEFVERGTINDLINSLVKEQRTVPDSTLWVMLHDVAAGLAHIHSCGVVHLDIKPANLLISAHGVIKIGDFGMAASVGSREDGKEGDTKYMANELLNDCERHPSADIFSLALFLYEASYSEKQLREGSISLPAQGQMWHVLRSGKAPPLRHRAPELAVLVATAMSPEPTLRPSAADILRVQEVAAVPSGLDREAQRAVADDTLLSAQLIQPNPRALPFLHQGHSSPPSMAWVWV